MVPTCSVGSLRAQWETEAACQVLPVWGQPGGSLSGRCSSNRTPGCLGTPVLKRGQAQSCAQVGEVKRLLSPRIGTEGYDGWGCPQPRSGDPPKDQQPYSLLSKGTRGEMG